jgi:2Fe-2S ferredoxin
MVKVTFIEANGASHDIDIPAGENVMRGALNHEIPGIVGECGGGLACATCHCYVDDAFADQAGTPTSRDEADMLESVASEQRPTSRLACQIEVTPALEGLVIHLPEAQF